MTNTSLAAGPLPTALVRCLQPMAYTADGRPAQAGILLQHGHASTSARLAPRPLRGPLKLCFSNSTRALAATAAERGGWRYCEGYAYDLTQDLLFEHAWLLDPDGTAWETTWTDTTNVVYLGMAFDMDELLELLEESDEPLLFGDWDRGWPLLRSHYECCRRLSPPE
ncbi:hypothetical protein [Nocardioides sp. URHA0032]|uniref:hypothetical protein n=1 Tax=Nocardioides sp. URHA0032 TaxID=1380388 RepID=UPI0012DED90B|nr:hypothetical protein [Nocardioides sp. URHA0032]